MPPLLRPVLAVLAFGWASALLLAPLLPTAVAAVLYAGGSLICHQISERSFHLNEFQLPVCARCFGLYVGGFAGTSASVAAASAGWVVTARRRLPLTLAAAAPTVATIVLEHGLGWPLSNVARAVAAVPLAAAIAFVVAGAAPTVHYGECAPRRPIADGRSHPPAST